MSQMLEYFRKWPMGHGYYAAKALKESIAENRRKLGEAIG